MRGESKFYFSINSKWVGGITMEDFDIDFLGVVVNSDSEEPITYYFDNLEVYDLR
jgi:hypothetical protein